MNIYRIFYSSDPSHIAAEPRSLSPALSNTTNFKNCHVHADGQNAEQKNKPSHRLQRGISKRQKGMRCRKAMKALKGQG